jgi:hypothetical protein
MTKPHHMTVKSHRLTHGHAKRDGEGRQTTEYISWLAMRSRCERPTNNRYYTHGGRGVKVCERWLKFENFLADMGKKPSPKHSVDRIDNDGHYEPSNCRWASPKEQSSNTRRNVFISHNGIILTAQQWADRTGINRRTILQRFRKGWPSDRILKPVG